MADNLDIPDFLKRKEKVKMPNKQKAAKEPEVPKAVIANPPTSSKEVQKLQAKLDAFGFREGTIKSKAAALYADKGGATLAEVKAKTSSTQLNLLKECEGHGHTVTRVKEAGKGTRKVTRYFLVAKK